MTETKTGRLEENERERFALLQAAATVLAMREDVSYADAVSDAKILLALIDRSKNTPVEDADLKPGKSRGRFQVPPGINIWPESDSD